MPTIAALLAGLKAARGLKDQNDATEQPPFLARTCSQKAVAWAESAKPTARTRQMTRPLRSAFTRSGLRLARSGYCLTSRVHSSFAACSDGTAASCTCASLAGCFTAFAAG